MPVFHFLALNFKQFKETYSLNGGQRSQAINKLYIYENFLKLIWKTSQSTD